MKISKYDREKAFAQLQKHLKPGDTVNCILQHVSRSGMSRRIDFYKLTNSESIYLTASIADLLGYRYEKPNNGLTVKGCGMDMGFAVVYKLACILWPQGFDCIGEKCPSDDHVNGDRNYRSHNHKDGGYALQHNWL